jgi:hypothetical protein
VVCAIFCKFAVDQCKFWEGVGMPLTSARGAGRCPTSRVCFPSIVRRRWELFCEMSEENCSGHMQNRDSGKTVQIRRRNPWNDWKI